MAFATHHQIPFTTSDNRSSSHICSRIPSSICQTGSMALSLQVNQRRYKLK